MILNSTFFYILTISCVITNINNNNDINVEQKLNIFHLVMMGNTHSIIKYDA